MLLEDTMSVAGRCLLPVIAWGVLATVSCSGSGSSEVAAQPEAGQGEKAETPRTPDEAKKIRMLRVLEGLPKPLTITSPAMQHHGTIPEKYTCDGSGVSPQLDWQNPPEGTKSFALIVEDPDAAGGPGKSFVHWVVYDMPVDVLGIPEGVAADPTLKSLKGAKQGKNDFGSIGWGAPCPPPGGPAKGHRYLFRLYALDAMIEVAPGATRIESEKEMKGHVIGQTGILATYARKAK